MENINNNDLIVEEETTNLCDFEVEIEQSEDEGSAALGWALLGGAALLGGLTHKFIIAPTVKKIKDKVEAKKAEKFEKPKKEKVKKTKTEEGEEVFEVECTEVTDNDE